MDICYEFLLIRLQFGYGYYLFGLDKYQIGFLDKQKGMTFGYDCRYFLSVEKLNNSNNALDMNNILCLSDKL